MITCYNIRKLSKCFKIILALDTLYEIEKPSIR